MKKLNLLLGYFIFIALVACNNDDYAINDKNTDFSGVTLKSDKPIKENLVFKDSEKTTITWHWEDNQTIGYETKDFNYTDKSGIKNSASFDKWYLESKYGESLLFSYTEQEAVKQRLHKLIEERTKNNKGYFQKDCIKQYEMFAYILSETKIDSDKLKSFKQFEIFKLGNNPRIYKVQNFINLIKGSISPEEQEKKDLELGEYYLSSGYKLINPLLLAFEKSGYSPDEYVRQDFDYSKKIDLVLKNWKEIAISRKPADKGTINSWDIAKLNEQYKIFKTIMKVWDKFDLVSTVTKDNTIYRGDSSFLFSSYPALNTDKYTTDGAHNVDININWPGILSTTYDSNPKEHNFIKKKKIIWVITLPKNNQGRILGKNNPSEVEITFPPATKLSVKKLIVRKKDKSILKEKLGEDAELIIYATIK